MTWYKIAQFQSQKQDLDLILKPNKFSSALIKSERLMHDLNLEDILTEFATKKGYHDPLDYVLCSLYPELEKECQNYYTGKGQDLITLHSKHEIAKIDTIVSKSIQVFFYKYQEILKEK